MTAQEILKMIETVDPADTAKLDEIDCRVACYLQGFKYGEKITRLMLKPYPFYTRSRDALKAIRPEGWFFEVSMWGFKFDCSCDKYTPGEDNSLRSETLPTEEMAELHAIIQAIEHDRNK